MDINHFKVGDIITRNEGMKYAHNQSIDSSYCGDRLILEGLDSESKTIFLREEDDEFIKTLSYARDRWDEGWVKYPESIYQRLIQKFKIL